MAQNNGFLAKQKALKQTFLDIGIDIGYQQMFDMLCLTLHDQDVMGKDTFGKDRMIKVMLGIKKHKDRHEAAFDVNDVFADYNQSKLDRELREIFGDGLDEFELRYPSLKKAKY